MKPEIKQKWLAALRSGEYKQGVDMLRDSEGGFCCLGVLCDLYAKENPNGQWDIPNEQFIIVEDGERMDSAATMLPSAVRDWAGLAEIDPATQPEVVEDVAGKYDSIESSSLLLSELNDSGASFEILAAIIEADPDL